VPKRKKHKRKKEEAMSDQSKGEDFPSSVMDLHQARSVIASLSQKLAIKDQQLQSLTRKLETAREALKQIELGCPSSNPEVIHKRATMLATKALRELDGKE